MDPNKTLANIRAIVTELDRAHLTGDIVSLADELTWMVKDIDKWLSSGGFLPTEWNHAKSNAA
jgi:hypothetical protein